MAANPHPTLLDEEGVKVEQPVIEVDLEALFGTAPRNLVGFCLTWDDAAAKAHWANPLTELTAQAKALGFLANRAPTLIGGTYGSSSKVGFLYGLRLVGDQGMPSLRFECKGAVEWVLHAYIAEGGQREFSEHLKSSGSPGGTPSWAGAPLHGAGCEVQRFGWHLWAGPDGPAGEPGNWTEFYGASSSTLGLRFYKRNSTEADPPDPTATENWTATQPNNYFVNIMQQLNGHGVEAETALALIDLGAADGTGTLLPTPVTGTAGVPFAEDPEYPPGQGVPGEANGAGVPSRAYTPGFNGQHKARR